MLENVNVLIMLFMLGVVIRFIGLLPLKKINNHTTEEQRKQIKKELNKYYFFQITGLIIHVIVIVIVTLSGFPTISTPLVIAMVCLDRLTDTIKYYKVNRNFEKEKQPV